MAEFWLGTHEFGQKHPASDSNAEPILSGDLKVLAIEVIREADACAVLLSAADDKAAPGTLECRIGFSNSASGCNRWRDRGFPLVDAEISYDKSLEQVTVRTPCFGKPGAMVYREMLLKLTGVRFGLAGQSQAPNPEYRQHEMAPDSGWPATRVRSQEIRWAGTRQRISASGQCKLSIEVVNARSPSLRPLQKADYMLDNAWTGELSLPEAKAAQRAGTTEFLNRADTFGVPAFRFQDVEAIGFRIDLPRDDATDQKLKELLAPLNFHLDRPDVSIPDFRYRAANRTLLVELLRYGKMRLKQQDEPLTEFDYQSQHELVVRILVGRVDDDAAHARDPAVFVPAIFVDNPWSKILGRDLQGFGKCLANFCVDDGLAPLTPEGNDAAGNPRPLSSIRRISLMKRAGAPPIEAEKMLDVDCRPWRYPNWDELAQMSPGQLLSGLSLTEARWQRFDFREFMYLGSFLRTALSQLVNGFRSVQSSPVGEHELDKAWITGKFTVDDVVKLGFPIGTARLTFHHNGDAPPEWNQVCDLVSFRPYHDFHTSRWYRMKFSMNMTVDDGLEWDV